MSKKDRIAIVASLGWWILLYFGYGSFFDDKTLILMIPVGIYWAYRFIKKGE